MAGRYFSRTGFSRFPPLTSFPRKIYVTAVFPCEEGYVILRKYEFGRYPYQDPLLSYSPSYYQIIATGYDTQGIPLWQTVGSPQVG